MKKENYLDHLYDDVFPDWLIHREVSELGPTCAYCNSPDLEQGKQFCCEQHENLYYDEADLYWSEKEEEYLREKKEK